MTDLDSMYPSPWSRYSWHGALTSTDDCNVADFTRDDIASVVAYGETNAKDWDGKNAGIVLLKDGRYVSWESWWGPTGSGFCDDAYGGDTDIIFSKTLDAATKAISESARELMQWGEAP
jgi:hypothetical protein